MAGEGMTLYGNPRPYASPELERSALTGRLRVARGIAARYARSGQTERFTRWSLTVDELLEHLLEVDTRAASASMDKRTNA
jgi:hypothetical protein